MIFGGFDGNHYDDVFAFNIDTFSIIRLNLLLKKKWSFIQRNSTTVDDDKYFYSVGFPFVDIHRYSFL